MSSMCYTNDARSPLPPIVGGSTDEGDLVLTATDGNRFRAYAARAAAPSGAGVVVIPDPRGVHPFYKDLVSRFAQAGVDAIVIDYIDRTAGMSERPENFDLRAAIGKTRQKFRIGGAVFLNCDAPSGEWHRFGLFVESSQKIAPGIRFRHSDRYRDTQFLQGRHWFRTARHDGNFSQRGYKLFNGINGLYHPR